MPLYSAKQPADGTAEQAYATTARKCHATARKRLGFAMRIPEGPAFWHSAAVLTSTPVASCSREIARESRLNSAIARIVKTFYWRNQCPSGMLQIKWVIGNKGRTQRRMNSDDFNGKNLDVLCASRNAPPAFRPAAPRQAETLGRLIAEAVQAWVLKTPSAHTRRGYANDVSQFLSFCGISPNQLGRLAAILPADVSAWRDELQRQGLSNATIRRKLTTLRSLFSYLQVYGYSGANPAHGKFVAAPAASRDGKTVGLSPHDCRRLLEAPLETTPAGVRDRAILAVLAYSACRVGELVRLRVADFRISGEHRVLNIRGKGGKERVVPLHVEAVERLAAWITVAAICEDRAGPLFRAAKSPRGHGRDGFRARPLTTRSIQQLIRRYARRLRLDSAVTVHSLRVTALTTARDRGSDIIDLQDFAGHADPRTTLTYIRSRDRLSKSPAYVLHY